MEWIEIKESEIADYLFEHLIELGYVPEEEELDDLAMLVFDFLVSLGAMDEDEIEMEDE
jgi:hypothetical protein